MLNFDVKLAHGRNPPLLCLHAVVHVMLAGACALPMIVIGSCLLFVTTMAWHCDEDALPTSVSRRGALVGMIIFLSPVVLFIKLYGVVFHKDGVIARNRTISHCFCPYQFWPQRFRCRVILVTLCAGYLGTLLGDPLLLEVSMSPCGGTCRISCPAFCQPQSVCFTTRN
jgi:hypothetical protein